LPLRPFRFLLVFGKPTAHDVAQCKQQDHNAYGSPDYHVFSSFGTNSGIRTTLVYDVQYSSCQMSEKLIIFKPSGAEIQIQGHLLKHEAGQIEKGESQATLST
jgi:hypothetical protein